MKKFLLFAFAFFSLNIQAQEATVSKKSLFSINFLLPGFEYEASLSEKTTLDMALGFGFAYRSGMFGEGYGIFPGLTGQYRWFYNLDKRLEKGKSIDNNTGNYLALHAGGQSGKPILGNLAYNADFFGTVGPVWGLQRYYGSGFKLGLHLGAGYAFNNIGDSGFSPILGFRLGWLLGK